MFSENDLKQSDVTFFPPLHLRRRTVKVSLITPSGAVLEGIKLRLEKTPYDDWKPNFIVPNTLKVVNRPFLAINKFPISEPLQVDLETLVQHKWREERNRVKRLDPFSPR